MQHKQLQYQNFMYASVMSNIFSFIKNLVDIFKDKYYLNMGAKYYNSIVNDACTMSPTDIVGHPAKVIQPTPFFSNCKHLFV